MDWKIFLILMIIAATIPFILFIQSRMEIKDLKKRISCLLTENGNMFSEKVKLEMEVKFYRGVYENASQTNREAEKKLLDNIDNWNPFDATEIYIPIKGNGNSGGKKD